MQCFEVALAVCCTESLKKVTAGKLCDFVFAVRFFPGSDFGLLGFFLVMFFCVAYICMCMCIDLIYVNYWKQ